jgi:hypothetical protein
MKMDNQTFLKKLKGISITANKRSSFLITSKPREKISIESLGTIESDGLRAPVQEYIDSLPENCLVNITITPIKKVVT